jgi:hypothetical protein
MKTQLDPCDPDRLRLLAEDRLPPAAMAGIEQHLERCVPCRDVLDRLVGDDRYLREVRHYLGAEPTVSYGPSPAVDESLDFLAPSDWPDSLGRLGTYEVKGVLGRGGMGVVLKAFDPALNRNVAIKVMSAPLASCGAARQRFLREARAAAAVVHEHVVGVKVAARRNRGRGIRQEVIHERSCDSLHDGAIVFGAELSLQRSHHSQPHQTGSSFETCDLNPPWRDRGRRCSKDCRRGCSGR